MSANSLNKQEKNLMELHHKILKIYHHQEANLLDLFQVKSSVDLEVRI